METNKDRRNSDAQLIQQQDSLLLLLSKYFDQDKKNISLQVMCNDLLYLSKATFCLLNIFDKNTGLLQTNSISHSNLISPDSEKLLSRTWEQKSFLYITTETPVFAYSANKIFAEAGFNSDFLLYCGLNNEENNLGSVIFGFEKDQEFETKKSVEYLIKQLGKIIPYFIEDKSEPFDYFKDSEVIKKSDTDIVFVIDRELCIVDTNSTDFPTKGSGYAIKAILSIVPDNLKSTFLKTIEHSFDSGNISYEEVPLQIEGNEDVFYAIKFIPIKKGEYVEKLCMIATNTEEQKHILRDFNILQNFAKIGWWELHLPSNKLLWSEGLFRLMELDTSSGALSDELYITHVHPEDRPFVEKTYQRALKDGRSEYEITYRLLMKDGRVKWVTDKCITYFDDEGNQFRSLGIIQDITQLKKAELKLKKINGSYKRLNDQVPGIIFEYQIFENGERRFNSISEKVAKKIGYSTEEMKEDATIVWEHINPEDLEKMKQAFAESARTLKRVNVDYRVALAGEGERVSWKRIEATPEKQEDNSRIWYGYISEINEMKEAQFKIMEAKEEAERANRAKTEFLANMSHEIRTPMNAVLGFSELLKGNTTGPKYESYIDGILSGGKNLLSLIDDILDLSKIEAGQMNIQQMPVNLERLANEFKQLFAQKANEKGIEFIIHFEEALPKNILIDETRIRQVLFNLVGNAFKFTDRGSVTLSFSMETHKVDNSRIDLVFSIRDTGIGIPSSQHTLIFESFKQQDGQSNRKYGGTGLGLTITKRLVDMMNGTIHLESTPGSGSCFSVHIKDIHIACMEEDEPVVVDDSVYVFQGQKILLVEDVFSNREVIKGFLEPLNLKISIAENGQEALSSLKCELPDLILMDMMMPLMDGYTAIKIIRGKNIYNHIPIVALTASALKQSEMEIRELCNDYLRKPVSKKDLSAVLSRYLSHSIVESKAKINQDRILHELPVLSISEELQRELRTLFLERWQEVATLMSIDDIVNFTVSLNTHAVNIKHKELESYCGKLLSHAENFDIDKMNMFFQTFKNYMNE